MMSDTVKVALIAGTCNILAVVFSRLLSRLEHKETTKTVNEIKKIVNGRDYER